MTTKEKNTISSRQRKILGFIQDFQAEKGYLPSLREILKACNISSTSVVDYNLKRLEEKGYMKRDKHISRGIGLSKSIFSAVPGGIPMAGTIAAGQPIPVPSADTWADISATVDRIEVPQDFMGGKETLFALKVKGNSMIDALIADGDTVIMEPADTAENGEMVAVWLKEEKEVTLKKIYFEEGRVRLQPANTRYHPLYTSPDNIEVQGKVVAVLRRLKKI